MGVIESINHKRAILGPRAEKTYSAVRAAEFFSTRKSMDGNLCGPNSWNYFNVNEGCGYQDISPTARLITPIMPPKIPGYPYQPWVQPQVRESGNIRAEQVSVCSKY